jgi:hypothetical protein
MSSQLSPDTESLLILIYVFFSSVLITSLSIVFAFRILTGIPDYLIAHKHAKTIKEKQIKKTQKQKAKITNDNDTASITGGGNHKKSDKEFVSATDDKSTHGGAQNPKKDEDEWAYEYDQKHYDEQKNYSGVEGGQPVWE